MGAAVWRGSASAVLHADSVSTRRKLCETGPHEVVANDFPKPYAAPCAADTGLVPSERSSHSDPCQPGSQAHALFVQTPLRLQSSPEVHAATAVDTVKKSDTVIMIHIAIVWGQA